MEEQNVNEQAVAQPSSTQPSAAEGAANAAPSAPVGSPASAGRPAVAAPSPESGRKKSHKKVITGQVVSNKMDKTAVVLVTKRRLHRLYKKYITESKKVKVHDQKNECGVGDTVRVMECRPLSKDKRWRLLEIMVKAK